MIFFINVLRALATCLITNSHYTGVYPTDIIANGGLIGDVIFFAVSGYCLFNVKGNFIRWYGKRVWRCYLPVFIITALYMLIGCYSLESHDFVWWFIYPTYYHFVASIVVLYIPFYILMRFDFLKKHIPFVMLGIFFAYAVVYIFAYDKSYYHIDTVREPIIRFLFMESMLLGAYFKQRENSLKNSFSLLSLICLPISFVIYFASKLVFSSVSILAPLQFLNQILIFVLLYFVFRTFVGIDSKLEELPTYFKKIVVFLSGITLEIYVVQYVIIDLLKNILPFPLNWLALTTTIILSAYVLHLLCKLIMSITDRIIEKICKTSKRLG